MKENCAEKVRFFKNVNELAVKGEIAVFGSTYSANFPFYELMQGRADYAVYNRSIEGLTVKEAAAVASDCLKRLNPSKLFLCLGEEELKRGVSADEVYENYRELIKTVGRMFKCCDIYVLPVMNENAGELNGAIRAAAERENVKFLTIAPKDSYRSVFNRLNCFFRGHAPGFCEAFGI